MVRIYALLSEQGTACLETRMTESEYADIELRRIVERNRDEDVTTIWVEVSDNDAFQDEG